jgi:hypothetical protein
MPCIMKDLEQKKKEWEKTQRIKIVKRARFTIEWEVWAIIIAANLLFWGAMFLMFGA